MFRKMIAQMKFIKFKYYKERCKNSVFKITYNNNNTFKCNLNSHLQCKNKITMIRGYQPEKKLKW